MPVERCQRDGESGYRWGKQGHCYLPSEEGSDEAARKKAEKQGRVIESRRHTVRLTIHSIGGKHDVEIQ